MSTKPWSAIKACRPTTNRSRIAAFRAFPSGYQILHPIRAAKARRRWRERRPVRDMTAIANEALIRQGGFVELHGHAPWLICGDEAECRLLDNEGGVTDE